jgi:hypothetical protein
MNFFPILKREYLQLINIRMENAVDEADTGAFVRILVR